MNSNHATNCNAFLNRMSYIIASITQHTFLIIKKLLQPLSQPFSYIIIVILREKVTVKCGLFEKYIPIRMETNQKHQQSLYKIMGKEKAHYKLFHSFDTI